MSLTESRRIAARRSPRRLAPARRSSWPLTGAAWLCVLVATAGLGPMLVAARWWLVAAAVAAIILVVAALVRMSRLPAVLASLSGPITYALVMTWIFTPASTFFLLPTPDTLTAFGELFQEGVKSIYRQTMPAVVEPGLLFILVAGVGLIAVAFDLMVFSLGVPALAGILLVVVLAIPVVTRGSRLDWVVFVATAVSFMMLLRADMLRRGVHARDPSRRRRRGRGGPAEELPRVTGAANTRIGRQSVLIAAVSIVGAMLLGAVLPGYDRPPPIPVIGNTTIFGGAINPIISLGKDLRQQSEAVMLSYTTTMGKPPYLSVITLDRFSGENWSPTLRDPDPARPATSIGQAPGLSEQTPRGLNAVTDITIDNLISRWLPLPYPPTTIDIGERDWFWEPSDLSVSGEQLTTPGLKYTVTSVQLKPTAQILNSAPEPVETQQFLALPEELPTIISETARTVTDSATSHYEQAVMLQEYFRGSSFNYSLEAPVRQGYDGDGMAVLEQFLDVRSGYCAHFASAMAVMARSLGIPTRIAVGFQPGTPVTEPGRQTVTQAQKYDVSGADLHAWPQLYFEGIGWLDFEPTPSRGDPAPYSLPESGSTSEASAEPSAAPSPGSSAAPSQAPGRDPLDVGEAQLAGEETTTGNWIPTAVLLAILLLLLLPAATRIVIRAVRLRAGDDAREFTIRAWRELLASATDLGVVLPTTGTPREVQRELSAVMGPDDGARQALARFVSAVEHAWFAPPGTQSPGATAGDARIILMGLRRSLPISDRLQARFLPASLLGHRSRSVAQMVTAHESTA